MRRKPVSRDEVRFNGSRITTLPVNAVREDRWGDLEPIRKLWAPLLRSINRARKRQWDRNAAMREQAVMAGVWGFSQHQRPQPITAPFPCRFEGACKCQQCGGKFYRTRFGSYRYCSDRCADLARRETRKATNAARVKERSAARAAVRADRKCVTCSEPITAQRSTMRFCSVRCRVAAHREPKPPSLHVRKQDNRRRIPR